MEGQQVEMLGGEKEPGVFEEQSSVGLARVQCRRERDAQRDQQGVWAREAIRRRGFFSFKGVICEATPRVSGVENRVERGGPALGTPDGGKIVV